MTSPSHKKRPTTPPSIPAETISRGEEAKGGSRSLDLLADAAVSLPSSAYSQRQEPLWLPAGALAAIVVLTMALSAAGAEPNPFDSNPTPAASGWRPVGGAAKATTTWRSNRTGVAKANADVQVKFVGAANTAPHPRNQVKPAGWDWRAVEGSGVVTVAFDDDPAAGSGPEFRVAQRGQASMRSIVVPGDSSYRIAQGEEPDFGAELSREIDQPFGADDPAGTEELPPIDGPSDSEPNLFDDFAEPGDDADSGFGGGLNEPSMQADPIEGPKTQLPPIDDAPPAPTQPRSFDPQPPAVDEPEDAGDGLDDAFDDKGFDDDEFSPADGEPRDKSAEKRRQEAQKSCAEELAELKASRLSMIDIRIGVTGDEGTDFPHTCSIDDGTPYSPRCWSQITYMWKASGLCHKPLYFEQKHLERYGHSFGPYLDPVVAGAHFFTRLPALPYAMGLRTPNECVYTLGYYRPGSCAPYMIEQPGITKRAILFETGAWTGGVFAIP